MVKLRWLEGHGDGGRKGKERSNTIGIAISSSSKLSSSVLELAEWNLIRNASPSSDSEVPVSDHLFKAINFCGSHINLLTITSTCKLFDFKIGGSLSIKKKFGRKLGWSVWQFCSLWSLHGKLLRSLRLDLVFVVEFYIKQNYRTTKFANSYG